MKKTYVDKSTMIKESVLIGGKKLEVKITLSLTLEETNIKE